MKNEGLLRVTTLGLLGEDTNASEEIPASLFSAHRRDTPLQKCW
jgi:hypothetical protein